MIRLNVFVRVSETNREKAIEAAKELTTCSLKEEGCIAYDTFESSTRHDVFMICETWQNAEVLAAHEKSPHFGKYVGIIQELAETREVRILNETRRIDILSIQLSSERERHSSSEGKNVSLFLYFHIPRE